MKSSYPFSTVALSATTYHVAASYFLPSNASRAERDIVNKVVSAGHAALTTILSLCAVLRASQRARPTAEHTNMSQPLSGEYLDDSHNPFIQDRDLLSSSLTAWETGYLVYDTLALVLLNNSSNGLLAAIRKTFRNSPDFLFHHLLLATGLMYLQTYIARQRDKGIRIVVTLLLMNASNPLLHMRWWARRQGKPSRALDLAFLITFAASRFGPLAWVMYEYGKYHDMGAFEAWKWLRKPCQAGMVGLFSMNAIWWLLLVKGIVMKSLKQRKKA